MPTLRNPHDYSLFSHILGREVEPDESVEITDEQAAAVGASGVWVVEGVGKARKDAADESSATAKRATAKRGAKVVEQDDAPDVETR